jgi:gas vesicle protein
MNGYRTFYSKNAKLHMIRNVIVLSGLILTIGLGTGVVLALLFAPSTGKQTRHDLAKKIEEGVQTGRDAVEPKVKQFEEQFSDMRETVGEQLSDLRENVEERVKQN